jgi:hypothetical protein
MHRGQILSLSLLPASACLPTLLRFRFRRQILIIPGRMGLHNRE